jgi:hypothetical protein
MYKDFGVYHPFTLHKSKEKIRSEALYKMPDSIFILRGTVTGTKTNILTGDVTSLNVGTNTWDVNGIEYTATLVEALSMTVGQKYYLTLIVDGETFYTDIIECIAENDCLTRLLLQNDCNNINWNWIDAIGYPVVPISEVQQNTPETTTEYETIITAQGEQKVLKRQIQRQRFWFVAPKGYSNVLNGAKGCSDVYFRGNIVKNFDFSEENVDDFMSSFTISFEYPNEQEGNDCCDDIDLDTILNPDNGGGGEECEGFTIEIVNTDDTLSVTLTDPPLTGTPSYKWYRNNLQISTASTISIVQAGNYKVEVIQAGCKQTTTYFKDDVCGAMSLRVYSVGNFVNGDLSNVPDGCTPTTSVTLNGVEVATSLPYEVAETGTYFVKVTACNCIKSGGVFVLFSETDNCDFTVDIDQTGNLLAADTDAITPTYLWELETSAGRTTIAATSSITASTRGIYWLTVTSGGCSKETYLYLEPLASQGVFVRSGGTGTAFTIVGINLLNITDHAGTIKVTVNGVVFSYVAGSPSTNQYSVNISGQITVQTSLTNPTIIVELI